MELQLVLKKLSLQLSAWDDELLLAPNITTFLPKSLPKLHEPALSSVIPYPLCAYISLSLIFTTLVATNNQFLNLEFLVGFPGQACKSETMEVFTVLVKHFFSTAKRSSSIFIPILYLEGFMLCKKAVYNDLR